MSKTQNLTDQQRDRIILEAVRRRLHAALSFRTDSGWKTLKGRFCACGEENESVSISLLEWPEARDAQFAAGDVSVGCAFRFGHKKCMFCSSVKNARVESDRMLIELTWPDRIQQVQRRLFERADVPPGAVIPVRFWREVNGSTDQRRVMRHGQLEDLSVGGMRVQVSDLSEVQREASYQCVFTPRSGSPAVVLDAILRHHEPNANGRISLGLQFVGLETTQEGRRVIDRLVQTVQYFQRLQSKRGVGSGVAQESD
ncbi:MAG: PilZ domain-containing protein [Phycisphaerae bacterium]|nr:PilZ domain-containing protein [Phycisphaerae bacterium]